MCARPCFAGLAPTLAETRETVSLYNVMGELVSRTDGAGAAATAAATATASTDIAYNGAGQPTTHAVAGATTTFAYDASGFRTGVTSPNFGAVTSTYTKFGELDSRTDGKGMTTWEYDALGRPTKRRDPDGVAQWSYDPANARGALKRRCYEKGDDATACAGLADSDFNEDLEYDDKARLSEVETTRRQELRARLHLRHRRADRHRRLSVGADGALRVQRPRLSDDADGHDDERGAGDALGDGRVRQRDADDLRQRRDDDAGV